ncbi:hypothetical protein [Flavobacterium sp. 5]|uniref:hypothetical protein n=1 Tax=Flavobacterium sp. 5 TaxID=2035199 RepID=UPI000C2C6BAB|nr:hypothetical protein [Flavobacterium sp. 5]PKB17654.1 hypothetical protein CLU82_2874 [Flavobacterium sp. 5]
MKKFIFLTTALLFMIKVASQTTPNNEFTKDYYLQKSKNKKTTGWVLLSAGVGITIVGVIGFSSTFDDWNNDSTDAYGYLMLGGPLVALGSIPFFISSGSNARKSATLSINYHPILTPNQISVAQNIQPALSLRIEF